MMGTSAGCVRAEAGWRRPCMAACCRRGRCGVAAAHEQDRAARSAQEPFGDAAEEQPSDPRRPWVPTTARSIDRSTT